MRVMLVDDNRLMLQGLSNLLGADNIDVVGVATDGSEALDLARTVRPDIILMDLRMRDVDGLTATRLIKAEMPEIRIIILTTSTNEQDLFEAVRSGATGYLVKSIDAEALTEALEQAMEGAPPFSRGMAEKLLAEFARLGQPPATTPARDREEVAAPPRSEAEAGRQALTERQREVLQLLASGLTYKEIGVELGLSPRTVKYHMGEIMDALHLEHRAQVLAYAGRYGLGHDPA